MKLVFEPAVPPPIVYPVCPENVSGKILEHMIGCILFGNRFFVKLSGKEDLLMINLKGSIFSLINIWQN
ncbi:hypothetical protein BpHYR1_054038 [Brachionus plicatilis]|uniref:Uncharacterized protein n=1 Tax=Brachionus plicatilis TaxID=10195 RepID=A0A3M7QGL1_BRAPC|nr:hypothetical protein BpHYR1_054038 [Brachionus plicatilis]